MTGDPRYPQPFEDADNRPMLEAWREGRLLVQRCIECGRAGSYPRCACPHCWSERLRFETASGRGEIVSWSLVHRPNHESFLTEVPIVIAEIALAEGVRLIARVVGAPDSLRPGAAVELVADPERYPLPTFRIVPQPDRISLQNAQACA